MSATPSGRWLFGPVPDLLLGCGVGYLALTAFLLIPGVTESITSWAPLAFLTVILGLFTSTPHYGATLLRVYEHRSERRRYALFGVHATVLIIGLFVGGLYWLPLGSLILTLYITWSPWHFAGQNYGLALMFLRRRGVQVDVSTKRLLYASFVLSFLITLVALHGGSGTLHVAPVPDDVSVHYDFLVVGIPHGLSRIALLIFGSAYVLVLAAVAVSLLRRGRVADLGPTATLVLLQAVWFSIPSLLVLSGEGSLWKLTLSTIWVAIFHSIQYLWVTSYYAQQRGERSKSTYFWKTVLVGAGLFVFPGLIFMPELLGTVPYDTGLAQILFAAINLHHFMLDGAIWKLRDGRVAKVLLRAEPSRPEPITAKNPFGRRLAWAACAGALVIAFVYALELEFGVRRPSERGDLVRQQKAMQRLRWIGRESHAVHYNLGLEMAQNGKLQAARPHLERSVELYPTPRAWTALGNLERVEGRLDAALLALDVSLALDSGRATTHKRRGEVLAALGELDGAMDALREAQRLAPDNPNIRESVEKVKRWRANADTASGDRARPPPL